MRAETGPRESADARTSRHEEKKRRFMQLWNSGTPSAEMARMLGYTGQKQVLTRASELRQQGWDLKKRMMGRPPGSVQSARSTERNKKIRETYGERLYIRSKTTATIMDAKGKVIGELVSDGDKRTRVMLDGSTSEGKTSRRFDTNHRLPGLKAK